MKKILLAILFPLSVFSQSPSISLSLVANGFGGIVDIASAGDSRLFVVDGTSIKIVSNYQTLATPFLDLSDRAIWVMAVAFHPNYAQNGYFYVKYKDNAHSCVIARFSKDASDPNLADANSETLIFSYPNNEGHEGGDLEFGKDGLLYTTTGDNAPGGRGQPGDEEGNAQNLSTVRGKMLRFDVDVAGYIPGANPFQTPNDSIPDEIIALGLRNPWKFSFDRQTGDVWIGDVGQDSYEEVDYVPFGNFELRNYGWSCYEGNMPYLSENCPADVNLLTYPIITFEGYNFNGGYPASVTGGYVYRGSQYPTLNGYYCYADYSSGKFWLLKKQQDGSVTNDLKGILLANPTTFGEDNEGELYVATFGELYKVNVCSDLQDLTLSGEINTSGYYNALNSILSTNLITNNSVVSFLSQNFIELLPDFSTENVTVFKAQIGVCQ